MSAYVPPDRSPPVAASVVRPHENDPVAAHAGARASDRLGSDGAEVERVVPGDPLGTHVRDAPDGTGAEPFPVEWATVMIVDDEPVVIEVARIYLEEAGYRRFVTTTDPCLALALMDECRPDAVLLDINMPRMSGLELLAEVRATPRLSHTPIIVLTSASDTETKLDALGRGATDFLSKPVDSSELLLRLRNTLAAKAYQDRLAYLDPVTGHGNRSLFMERLERAAARADRDGHHCAVMQLGLDRFKQINDALGHGAGDTVLRVIARRLSDRLRPGDLLPEGTGTAIQASLSRIGGDEFAVLLSGLDGTGELPLVTRRLLEALAEPIAHEGQELFPSASVGVALYPVDSTDVASLVSHANTALSFAKREAPGTSRRYSDEIQSWSHQRLQMEGDLRRALERDELTLHYQPKVDAASGRIVGAEALMRWDHPRLGTIPPSEFIPVAEEIGVIVPLGSWAMGRASGQARAWREAGLGNLHVAVNVSSRQFAGQGIEAVVRDALARDGTAGHFLTVELTESVVMVDPERSVSTLRRLKALGVRISIDDFGTGYSSLAYLKRFPLDELKIDRSFVRDVPDDRKNCALVRTLVTMAHGLGMEVVAEGVETERQRRFLVESGCDRFQGYHFSPALPPDEFVEFVRAETRPPQA